jgi:hypothetical protein
MMPEVDDVGQVEISDGDSESLRKHNGKGPLPLPLSYRGRNTARISMSLHRKRFGLMRLKNPVAFVVIGGVLLATIWLIVAIFSQTDMVFEDLSGDLKVGIPSQIKNSLKAIRLWVNPPMEVHVHGATRVSISELLQGMPSDFSTWWWWLNKSEVKAIISRNPWVADLAIAPCRVGRSFFGEFSCREILIRERVPRFLIGSNGILSIAAEDGRILSTLPMSEDQALLARVELEDEQLIIVTGVISDKSISTIEIEKKIRLLSKAVSIIESEVGLRVDAIKGGSGISGETESGRVTDGMRASEIIVSFRGFPGVVTFSGEMNNQVIVREATRLSRLLHQFGAKSHLLRSVDLSFDKLAVVTLADHEKSSKYDGRMKETRAN